jgi:hypothetical protein
VGGVGQRDLAAARGLVAVFQIAVERGLTAVEVDRGDTHALIGQRHGDMDRRRRLAGSALFVGENDAMRKDPKLEALDTRLSR